MQIRKNHRLSTEVGETIMITSDRLIEMQIGKNLRYLRLRTFKELRNKKNKLITKHLTQMQVAEFLGITFQQIQKYENSINGLDSVKLYKLSKFFGVPLDFFFDETLIERQSFTKLFREENVQQQDNL